MIVRIQLDDRISVEAYQQLAELGNALPVYKPEEYTHWGDPKADSGETKEEYNLRQYKENYESKGYYKFKSYSPQINVDLNKIRHIKGLEFKIVEYLSTMAPEEAIDKLYSLYDKIENLQLLNTKCNVHIAGNHLMEIDEVYLLEDGCTDSLNDYLQKGYRIIACCVQPDGRRPDYILGKSSIGNVKSEMVELMKEQIAKCNEVLNKINDTVLS